MMADEEHGRSAGDDHHNTPGNIAGTAGPFPEPAARGGGAEAAAAVGSGSRTGAGADGTAAKDAPYEVGYGKPPRATRFKPGQSGNPRGRRKGTRNFRTYVREELEQKVTVRTDGHGRRVPKVQLIAMQLVNASVKGDLKSIEFLLKLADLMAPDEPEREVQKPMSEQERQLVFGYLSSIGVTNTNDRTVDDK